MMFIPDFLTDRAIISQLAVLAAIHYCAKRSLAERIVNITLTPPTITAEAKAKAEADKKAEADAKAVAAARPWHRRVFSYSTLEAFFPLILLAAFEFAMLWLLPRITKPIVLETIWVAISSSLIVGPISSCLYCFFGGRLTMAFVRAEKNPSRVMLKTDSATPDNKPFFFKKRNRQIAAMILTTGFVAYVAHDAENWVKHAFGGLVIIGMWSSIVFHKLTIRMASIFAFGFVTAMGILTPIVIFAMQYFSSNGDKSPSKLPPMPAWILSLMLIYNDSILGCPIMFLVMAALRYDHFGATSSPALGPDKAAPGAAVEIPRTGSVKARVGPMYRTAMATMAVCYLASGAVVYHLNANGTITVKPEQLDSERAYMTKLVSFASVNIFVPVVCAFVAYMRGDLKGWWSYSETWVVQDKDLDVEQADINEAEKALIEPEPLVSRDSIAPVSEKA